jgi:Rrf2 family protein
LALQGAVTDSSHPAQIPAIAQYCNIPVKYLEQILVVLRNQGLMGSRRGVAGGYYLMRPPSEITVGELVRLMDGNAGIGTNLTGLDGGSGVIGRVLQSLWEEVDAAIVEKLDSTTFADLRDRVRAMQPETNHADLMFYI